MQGDSAACEFGCGPADESNKPPGGFIVVAGCPVHDVPGFCAICETADPKLQAERRSAARRHG